MASNRSSAKTLASSKNRPGRDNRRAGAPGEPPARSREDRTEAAPAPDPRDPGSFVNRELGLIEFQRRVLHEALDEINPLLERVKFLAIVGSNLDEFFMVRVAGLRKQRNAGVVTTPPDGLTPAEQLAKVRKEVTRLLEDSQKCLGEQLLPALGEQEIHVLDYVQLSDKQKADVTDYFSEHVFPVLTPMAFDPGRPFPHISNLSVNLAVLIRDDSGEERFARVKIPRSLPRLVPLKKSSGGVRKDGTVPRKHQFVWLEQVVAANLGDLFPGLEVAESYPFRIVRDADTEIQEIEAADLLATMEESVRRRHFGEVVMVTLNSDMPKRIRDLLIRNLEIDANDVYVVEGPLGLSSLMPLAGIERRELKCKPFLPAMPARLVGVEEDGEDLFAAIRRHDIPLHHPYDSFAPVIDFLRTAARDPDVLAIKQTLYRIGGNSPVVEALLEARRNRKEVAVLVELKARFDEESNIEWAKALEHEGVHVIYGLLGLKTHSKIALVVRKEGKGIRRYVHLSTGNYNAVTANIYTDLGMFTCDPEIGADASHLFNYLTGYSTKTDYRKLLVAPIHLRQRLERLIQREIGHAERGGEGRMVFAMNALVDRKMIELLYGASRAGVRVDLLVRGICCLRPGIEGLSENIRVTSIVGRFLEHTRVYYFHNAGNEEVFLGSADLMPRNLGHRVEVVFPVQDPDLVRDLRDRILATQLADNTKSWRMEPDGSYSKVTADRDRPSVNSQQVLLEQATSRNG